MKEGELEVVDLALFVSLMHQLEMAQVPFLSRKIVSGVRSVAALIN